MGELSCDGRSAVLHAGRTEPQPMLRDAHDANSRCRPMRRLRRVVADVGREPGFGATLPRGCGFPSRQGRCLPSLRSCVAPRLGRLDAPGDSPVARTASRKGPRGQPPGRSFGSSPHRNPMWPAVPCGASARAPPLQRCGTVAPPGAHVGLCRQRCFRSQWMPRTIAPVTKAARRICLAESLPRQARMPISPPVTTLCPPKRSTRRSVYGTSCDRSRSDRRRRVSASSQGRRLQP